MVLKAKDRSPEEIQSGDRNCFDIELDHSLVVAFAKLSGDFNPLHTDPHYARSVGYRNGVAHGALQVAWVSQAAGMWLIGARCLIHKISSAFLAPLIYPCRVSVESTVQRWTPKHGAGQLLILIKNASSSEIFSSHSVEVSIQSPLASKSIKDSAKAKLEECSPVQLLAKTDKAKKNFLAKVSPENRFRPLLLVTGGTGGMLHHLVIELLNDYNIVLLGRDKSALNSLIKEVGKPDRLKVFQLDLMNDADHLKTRLTNLFSSEQKFWGLIHGASLPVMQQSILDVESSRLTKEWTMTATVPIRLAKWFSSQCDEKGGRMIMIGSENTKFLPRLYAPRYHLYALGKRLLRETARSLSQELASMKITVNTVHPGPIPQGMNAGMSPTTIRMLESENPLKRLCNTSDLLAAVHFFLEERAAYVSGQELYLNGGRF